MMPKRSSISGKHQGQEDVNESAFRVFSEAVGEIPPSEKKEKNAAAVELGRMGGKVGGAARASKLKPEERSRIARLAATIRWSKTSPSED